MGGLLLEGERGNGTKEDHGFCEILPAIFGETNEIVQVTAP